jgi:tetratricopeptide (TPR) repeat protein
VSRDFERCRALMLACCALATVVACSSSSRDDPATPAREALAPVALPDLSRADEGVRVQALEQYERLLALQKTQATDADLAAAHGELGMLLHAAEYFDTAEPLYRNAQTLARDDPRWPYYLALLHQATGRSVQAEAAFTRTLELEPDDEAALVRLARMLVERGDAAAAEPLFERARRQSARPIAALAGLGQVALAQQRPQDAVRTLEEGLALAPDALSLHAPLANAYRALGRTGEAERHSKMWRNTEIPLADPRKDALDELIESGLAYELRGLRAMSRRDWAGAAALFRKGIELAPPDGTLRRSLHHKLGTVLWMAGNADEALAEFEAVTRLAPDAAADEPTSKAYYSLGVVMASEGRTNRAVEQLSKAIEYGPAYVEARMALGDVLRHAGRVEESLQHYAEASRIDPRLTPARIGYATALIRLQRWRDARDWLEESSRQQPDNPDVGYLLARVLAAAPADGVRDGPRALALAESLARRHQTTAVGETLAMALAEVGDYAQAAEIQRGVLQAVQAQAPVDYVARVRERLRAYENRQPSRVPWTEADPVQASPGE